MAVDNKTSLLVEDLLPEYLAEEGPKFQAFIKAYYEWMETTGQATNQSKQLLTNQDIDETAEEFLNYFKNEILSQFPENIVANKNLVYKRIKDLYRSKGSEASYKLLFRILYDEEVEFYTPGQDLLRASDGRWVQETSIRITGPYVGAPDQLSGQITGQESGATARVERVQAIFDDSIYSFEIFVTDISGTFLDGEIVQNAAGDITAVVRSKAGALQSVIILDGGTGHQRNDTVAITSDSGSGGRGKISITSGGSIVKLAVTNVGSSFSRSDPVTIQNLSRSAANALGAPLVTVPVQYTGRYADVKGFVSWSNRLQDNRYYQEYSYVLRSSQVLNTYREIVKNVVHPAGTELFGDVLININIDAPITIKRETILRLDDIIPSDTFIPNVVSADIDQYTQHEELGAISDYPELEIESLPTVVDIDIPEAGTGFQVEIQLIATQLSAVLDSDEVITVNLVKLIEPVHINDLELAQDVTIQEVANVNTGFIQGGGHTLYWVDQFTWLTVGADVPINSNVYIQLSTFGDFELLPTASPSAIVSTLDFGDFTVEFGAIPFDGITSTAVVSNPALEYQIDYDATTVNTTEFSDLHQSYIQATGTVSTRFISANTINDWGTEVIETYDDLPIHGTTTTRVLEGTDTIFTIEAYANSQFMLRPDPDSSTWPSSYIYGILDVDSQTFDSNTIIATANVGIVTDADIFFNPIKRYEVIINTSITNTTIGVPNITITGTYSFDSANTKFDTTALTFDEVQQDI